MTKQYYIINDHLIKYCNTKHVMHVFKNLSNFKLNDTFDYNQDNYILIDDVLCNKQYYSFHYEIQYNSTKANEDYNIYSISKHDVASEIPLQKESASKGYFEYRKDKLTYKCHIIAEDNRYYFTINCECSKTNNHEANYLYNNRLYSIIYCNNCRSDYDKKLLCAAWFEAADFVKSQFAVKYKITVLEFSEEVVFNNYLLDNIRSSSYDYNYLITNLNKIYSTILFKTCFGFHHKITDYLIKRMYKEDYGNDYTRCKYTIETATHKYSHSYGFKTLSIIATYKNKFKSTKQVEYYNLIIGDIPVDVTIWHNCNKLDDVLKIFNISEYKIQNQP